MRILFVALLTLSASVVQAYASLARTQIPLESSATKVSVSGLSVSGLSVADMSVAEVSIADLMVSTASDLKPLQPARCVATAGSAPVQTASERLVEPSVGSQRNCALEATIAGANAHAQAALEAAVRSPLELEPTRLFNLETANQLPAGALLFLFGAHQTLSDDSIGTGSQLYYGGIDWGLSDDIQLSLSGQVYDDPPTRPINGQSPNTTLLSLAPSIKYRLLNTPQLGLSLQGSLESLLLSSALFDSGDGKGTRIIGSIHAPLTYSATPALQFHLTPGVSFFPQSLNDRELYGTLFTLGTGISWQPTQQWLFYSTLNLPIGPGGNVINTDQSIGRQPVWTVGTRYNLTPKTGLSLYATNGLGVTPATGILASIPSGDELLVGLTLNYAPDTGLGYRSSFAEAAVEPLTERLSQLLVNGITLTTASTLQPGTLALSTSAGTNSNYSVGLAYSPDEAFQIEAVLEDFGSDSSISSESAVSSGLRYMLGAKLRLLDQRQGDAVSLSARILGGRNNRTVGVLFAELPITYQASPSTALFFNPKLAAFSDQLEVGFGFGANYEIASGLQLLGEITPVFGGDRAVWAIGTRYSFPTQPLNIDLYATNAIGRNGLGTLIGQADAQFGIGLNWLIR